MTEQGSAHPDMRRRGVSFPQMSLEDAVAAILIAGEHGANHSHDAFAAYLGHSTANSGAFRAKLASLRDWGLISRGEKDRVVLSGLAQEIVMAHVENQDPKHLLLTAFEACRPFGMLHGDSAKNVPMDTARLRTNAIMRHAVASDQGDKFVDVFIKSAVYAGLAESDGSRVTLYDRRTIFTGRDEPEDEQPDATPVATMTSGSSMGTVSPQSVPTPATTIAVPTALRQTWPIDGGQIEFVIRTTEPLPPSIYTLVANMAEVAEEMKKKLSGPMVEMTTDNPPPAYRQFPNSRRNESPDSADPAEG